MKNIKVGVVGTGFIGPAHIEASRRGGIEVAAWRTVPICLLGSLLKHQQMEIEMEIDPKVFG
ncbi:MAG: hypothetical protein JST85_10370 [Acidobacteria bacterium]|nr:hypothetical protein [Acidobacteriota bacterium]